MFNSLRTWFRRRPNATNIACVGDLQPSHVFLGLVLLRISTKGKIALSRTDIAFHVVTYVSNPETDRGIF